MSTLEVSSEDRGPALLGVNYLFLTMAVAASALRCYTRLFIVRSFGIDDYFMAVATVSRPVCASDLAKTAC